MEGREQGSKKSQPLSMTSVGQEKPFRISKWVNAPRHSVMEKNKQNKTGDNKETNGILPFLYHVFAWGSW